jgi:hypothetical protein
MTCRGQERRFVTRNRYQLVEGLRIAKAEGASCLSRTIRPLGIEELPALSALCFRSKAVWGYDNDFMEACRRELSIEPCDLRSTSISRPFDFRLLQHYPLGNGHAVRRNTGQKPARDIPNLGLG